MLEQNDLDQIGNVVGGFWKAFMTVVALNFILGIGFIAAVLCLVKVLFF